MVALSVAIVFIIYFMSNQIVANETNSGIDTGLRLHSDLIYGFLGFSPLWNFIYRYISFIIFEFGLFVFIMRKGHKNDLLFWGITASLVVIPLIQMGTSNDFSMRVSIPGLVYICLMFLRYIFEKMSTLPKKIDSKSIKSQIGVIAAVLALFIGAITPTFEFYRETSLTIQQGIDYGNQYSSQESLENMNYGDNFTNEHYKDSAFYKISRH